MARPRFYVHPHPIQLSLGAAPEPQLAAAGA